jgi:hypothetical protein
MLGNIMLIYTRLLLFYEEYIKDIFHLALAPKFAVFRIHNLKFDIESWKV